MSGFEVIVRPVVFPNIRPAPSRSLPPEDDAEAGRTVLSGSSGQVISLTHSFTASGTQPGGTETQRTYDVARVKGDSAATGTFASLSAALAATGDEDAYIDVEVVKHVRMSGADGSSSSYRYAPIQESGNVSIIERDQVRFS